jgi:hypothetical protein
MEAGQKEKGLIQRGEPDYKGESRRHTIRRHEEADQDNENKDRGLFNSQN